MLVGTDRNIFTPGSVVRERIVRFGSTHVDALDSIVFSTRRHDIQNSQELSPGIHAHPTNSFSRFLYIWDAISIARHLPRPDIVSAQDPFETGLVALCIAHYWSVPFAVEMHTDFLSPSFVRHSLLNRVRVIIARFVLPRAAGGYAVSARVAEEINRRYRLMRIPMAVFPIFVDLARFRSIIRTPQKNNLLWIGRFETEKNPMLALEAFAAARRASIDVRLTMLGTGSLESALKRHVTRLGIEQQVAFPGWKDIAPYLADTDLLLVTSEYEGYGMALVEALAAGVPVLSTDVGIAREAGARIAEGDYATALCDWLKGPRLHGALKIHPYANEEEYFRSVRDHYEAIVENNRRHL